MPPENVLVTGSSGYLGALISKELVLRGYKVLGLDLVSPGNAGAISGGFSFIKADITHPKTLPLEIRRSSIVIHCAALVHRKSEDLSRENYFKVNLEGTRNLLSALDPIYLRRVIYLSTVSVYGDIISGHTADEQTSPAPVDYYGESKASAEVEVRGLSRTYGVPYTIFRLAPVYGRGFLMNLGKRVFLPKRVAFYRMGNGSQRLSLVAADNVSQAISECLRLNIGDDDTFNLKDREDYTINNIISALRHFYKRSRLPVIRIPAAIPFGAAAVLRRLSPKRGLSISYQLRKISGDVIYSGEKLFFTGIDLPWNLTKTLFGNVTLQKERHT